MPIFNSKLLVYQRVYLPISDYIYNIYIYVLFYPICDVFTSLNHLRGSKLHRGFAKALHELHEDVAHAHRGFDVR